MRYGKYITRCEKRAEITMTDLHAPRYKFEGFIMCREKPILHTAWDKDGLNMDSARYDISKKQFEY